VSMLLRQEQRWVNGTLDHYNTIGIYEEIANSEVNNQ
jgi:hypothetical protein